MKQFIKLFLIMLFYLLIFWGLISLFKHDSSIKECHCEDNIRVEVRPVSQIDISVNTKPGVETKAQYEAKKKAEEKAKKKAEAAAKKKAEEEAKKKKQTTKKKKTQKTKKVSGTSDKDTYKSYAYDLVINKYTWSKEDYEALVKLWTKESNWNPNAVNKKSGACNIPQALPCSKISKKYGDNSWQSGIKWGLAYIKSRYGSPKKAWNHFQNKGWY